METDVTKMLQEVIKGIDVNAEDTPEEADFRSRLVVQVKEIKDKGGIVDIPFETV